VYLVPDISQQCSKHDTTMQLHVGSSDVPKQTLASVFSIKIRRPSMGNTHNSRKFSKKRISVQSHSAGVATNVSPTHCPGLTKLSTGQAASGCNTEMKM